MCLDKLPEHVSIYGCIQYKMHVRLQEAETREPFIFPKSWTVFLLLLLFLPSLSFLSPPVHHLHDALYPIWRREWFQFAAVKVGVCLCLLAIVFTLSSLPDMMDGMSAIKQRPALDAWHPAAGTE